MHQVGQKLPAADELARFKGNEGLERCPFVLLPCGRPGAGQVTVLRPDVALEIFFDHARKLVEAVHLSGGGIPLRLVVVHAVAKLLAQARLYFLESARPLCRLWIPCVSLAEVGPSVGGDSSQVETAEVEVAALHLVGVLQDATFDFQGRDAAASDVAGVAFLGCHCGHPVRTGHPAVALAKQADEKRPALLDFLEANVQDFQLALGLVSARDAHAPAQVNEV